MSSLHLCLKAGQLSVVTITRRCRCCLDGLNLSLLKLLVNSKLEENLNYFLWAKKNEAVKLHFLRMAGLWKFCDLGIDNYAYDFTIPVDLYHRILGVKVFKEFPPRVNNQLFKSSLVVMLKLCNNKLAVPWLYLRIDQDDHSLWNA